MPKFLVLAISILFFFASCKNKEKISTSTTEEVIPTGKRKVSAQEKVTRLFLEANKQKILGNYSDAGALFNEVLKLDPENGATHYELSKLYLDQVSGSTTGVNELIAMSIFHGEKAAEIDNHNKWYLVNTAYLYEVSRQSQKAISTYQRLVGLHPNDLDYLRSLAAIEESVGNFQNAIDHYNTIEKKTSISKGIGYKKASLYIQLANLDRAALEIQKLIDEEPEEIDLYQKLAEILLADGKEEQALETFQKMKEINPSNGLTNVALSNFYREKGEDIKAHKEMLLAFGDSSLSIDKKVFVLLDYYKKIEKDTSSLLVIQTEELIQRLIEVHPNEAKTHTIAGDFYLQNQEKEKAIAAFSKASKLDGSRYVIWNQLSILQAELEQYDSLAVTAENSSALFPTQPIPYYFGGIAYSQLKEYDKSAEMLENGLLVVVDKPLKIQFYSLLGDTYNNLKKYAESDAAFEKALLADPNNAVVLNNYAYYLSERNEQLEKSKEMSKKSLEIEPNSATFADTYAWILFKMQDYKTAKTWIKKSIELGGENSAVIIEHYGDILMMLGETDNALEQWNKAKEMGGASEFIDKKIQDKSYYE